jgi:hypothetical protein
MQIKKTHLVCATKLLEGLKSTIGALRQTFFSVSEYLSVASGLCTNNTNFSSRQSNKAAIQGQEYTDVEMQFRMNIKEVILFLHKFSGCSKVCAKYLLILAFCLVTLCVPRQLTI